MFTTTTRTHVISSSMAIAVDQCHGFKPTIHNRRCRLRSFPHPDISPLDLDPLNLTRTPLSLTPPTSPAIIHRSFSSPCWSSSSSSSPINGTHDHELASGHNINIPRLDVIGGHGNRAALRALVVEATIAMASGMQLISVPGGLGGTTYCLRNRAGEKLAVLKPINMDQDHLSLSGPDSFRAGCMLGRPGLMRHSIRAVGTGMSEVAAYLLDHGGFSGVPPTALIKVSHPVPAHVIISSPTAGSSSSSTPPPPPWKIASIQRFVAHDYDAGDVGSSRFSVSSVHRIGILDVRLLNIDRHTGNILVKNNNNRPSSSAGGGSSSTGRYGGAGDDCELVPIDHELCLPERLDVDSYFEWLHWPQASVPFSESEAEYISSLNPLRDAELLRAELPMLKEASIRILVLCTVFLKRAAEAGLCLADIGGMMTREICGQGSSQLEALCRRAQVGMAKLIIFMRKMRNNINEVVGGGTGTAGTVLEEEEEEYLDDQFAAAHHDIGGGLIFSDLQDGAEMAVVDVLLAGKPPKVPKKTSCCLSTKVAVTSGGDHQYYYSNGSSSTSTADVLQYPYGSRFMSRINGGHVENGGFDSEINSAGIISFEGLSEGEWKLFMEMFEELLPSAFEARKGLRA